MMIFYFYLVFLFFYFIFSTPISFSLLLLFSCSVMSDTFQPHGLKCQASMSFPISWSLLKLISIELVVPFNRLILCHLFLFLPSVFPSIRVFSNESALLLRWPNTGASASASVPLMNIQNWFPLGWIGLISLQSKRFSVFYNTTVQKHQFFVAQPFLWSNRLTPTWLLEKP